MEIKVTRSKRRLRTVSARLVDKTLLVSAPLMLSQERLDKIVEDFRAKFARKIIKDELGRSDNLLERARRINARFFDNKLKLNSIEYVADQNCKFGCCNYRSANIRISHKIGLMPEWVRDYVVLHEMAHLIEPNHSRAFWEIVSRYKLAEKAKGFLIGTSFKG